MSYYANMAAQLQSRIKRRGNHIAAVEGFKVAYHKLGHLKKFRETKIDLEELRYEQVLDKKLLKVVQGIAVDIQRDEAEAGASVMWPFR